ncbi:MAG: VWA domain-containing protein, partial [Candidatus Heimdallarchaeota archaeon]
PQILVLLTDGRANTGLSNTADIEDEFHRANTDKVSLFTLGFGNDVDFPFLRRLARQNAGEAVKIEVNLNATEQITSFYESVSTPLLTNIRLTCNSGVVSNTIYPYFIPNLFDGSELFFVGERIADSPIELNITGHSSEGELFYIIKLTTPSSTNKEDSWIEKIWVIAKIDDLLTRIGYGDNVENNTETVTSMALCYGILTPYTAMFIDTEASEEEEISEEEPEDTYDQTYAPTTNTYAGITMTQTTDAPHPPQTHTTTKSPYTTEKATYTEEPTTTTTTTTKQKPTSEESPAPGFAWLLVVVVIPSIIINRRLRKD